MPGIDTEAIARAAFGQIQQRFPALRMVEEQNPHVEISITLPIQPGLEQQVWLCLQNNDELHFSVGHFWCEWFPCTMPEKVESYVAAVCGYVSGEYRIIEGRRFGRCIRAKLQRPCGGSWETIASWSRLHIPVPWLVRWAELRNA
ncbi:MAG: hypothetical protein NAOJABEB_02926 [Steroidobacteraceae bacterium]|nr:hypothetical protein [Steroidobacteraceae bacterium]